MSALVERIIAYRDDLRIGRGTMVRPTMDLMAEAANALDNYEKTMRVIAEQTDPASVAMNRARKALAAWDRYEPHLTSEGITSQANDMANAIRDILSTSGALPTPAETGGDVSQEPKVDETNGPYTCCQCCAATWNDDDWCDDCVSHSREISGETNPTANSGES